MSKLKNAWWWLMHRLHPRHRYHIIRTGLPAGYHEIDTRLLHGSFALLEEYVEAVGGVKKLTEWTDELDTFEVEHQAAHQREMLALYQWWKHDRPAAWAYHERDTERLWGDGRDMHMVDRDKQVTDNFNRTDRLHRTDEDMLIRLAKIRKSLWT